MSQIRLTMVLILAAAAGGCSSTSRAPVAGTKPPRDEEILRLSESAREAYDSGAESTALKLYTRAHARARALDDAEQIGNTAYNLAVASIALGRFESAQSRLAEAEAELIRAGKNISDVLLVEARLAFRLERKREALGFAERVLAEPGAPTAHRVGALLLKGRIACRANDATAARSALDEANRIPAGTADRGLTAEREALTGQIKLLEAQPAAAAAAFDREAALRQSLAQPHELAAALHQAAAAWRAAGNRSAAAERYFRAARSAFAQDARSAEAAEWINTAAILAAESGDTALQARAQRLQAEIARAAAAKP